MKLNQYRSRKTNKQTNGVTYKQRCANMLITSTFLDLGGRVSQRPLVTNHRPAFSRDRFLDKMADRKSLLSEAFTF